jgi:hypothetical protein
MAEREPPVRAIPPYVVVAVFVAWLGTTGVLLWHMDVDNRLRGATCSATR